MDADRFDTLSRQLGTVETRRGLLRLVGAVPLLGAFAALRGAGEAGAETPLENVQQRAEQHQQRQDRPDRHEQRKGKRSDGGGDQKNDGGGDQKNDGGGDGQNGGFTPGPLECTPEGFECAKDSECCSKQCVDRPGGATCGICTADDLACTTNNECCSQQCVNGSCSSPACHEASDCPSPKVCIQVNRLGSICLFQCSDGRTVVYPSSCPA